MRRKLAAGNWKMNGLQEKLSEVTALNTAAADADCEVLLCVPATLIAPMAQVADAVQVDSERRTDNGETDADVRDKTNMAWQAGLKAIVCVGETLNEREAHNTLDIIGGQLAGSIPDLATGENLVVAYEPVWAIGTGLTATTDQIGEVHDFIRMRLEKRFGEGVGRSVRILYGGSMNPKNVDEISKVSNVDGGLVGGASLKAADFTPIIKALG